MELFPLEEKYFNLFGYFFKVFPRGVEKKLTYEKLCVKQYEKPFHNTARRNRYLNFRNI